MFGFGKKKSQNAATRGTGAISEMDDKALLNLAEKLIAAADAASVTSKDADKKVDGSFDSLFVEANERAMASGEFINAAVLRRIAGATSDQALRDKANKILAHGRQLGAKEATQDWDTLSAGTQSGNQEAAVRAVVERNEKALVSAGYVDTMALGNAKLMTIDPSLRGRIDKILKAKGMVARIDGGVVVLAMEGELPP